MNLESSIESLRKEFKKELKKTSRRPSADHVHQLRVTTRKLRVDFWMVPKNIRTRSIKQSRKDLEFLGDILGRKRKYDVAVKDASSLGRGTSQFKDCAKESKREVRNALGKKNRKRYVEHLDKALEDLNKIEPREFIAQLSLLQRQLRRALSSPPKTTEGRHRLRVNLKKARYLIDAITKDSDTKALKKLQDALGKWHDFAVLATLSSCSPAVRKQERAQWARAEALLSATLPETTQALAHCVEVLKSSQAAE